MSIVDRFTAYAAAFEDAYASDDWNKIDSFFTEDAVYETLADPPFGGAIAGRDAIKAHFKQICAGFDRRFDSRTVELLTPPADRGGTVWFRWAAIYTLEGVPTLRMEVKRRRSSKETASGGSRIGCRPQRCSARRRIW